MIKSIRTLYAEHQGKLSDKWSLYLDEWERLFAPYRDLHAQILEIGIQNGGSLEVWASYFPKALKIVGCDIDHKCKQLRFDDARIAVVVGDANSDACEREILQQAPVFDIIIDDGSHHSGDMVRSFARYFPVLKEGGMYVVEDMHSSYWDYYQGGLHNPLSAMAFFKRLADVVNYEHWRNNKSSVSLLDKFAQMFAIAFDHWQLARIHSIEFVNSLCIVRKSSPDKNLLGQRIVTGREELITTGQKRYDGTAIHDIAMDIREDGDLDVFELITQNDSLAKISLEREQSIQYLSKQVSGKGREIQKLSARLSEKDQFTQSLAEQLAEKERAIQGLTVQLAEKERAVQGLTVQLAEKERGNQILTDQLVETEQAARVSKTKLNNVDAQLKELLSSKAWKLAVFFRLVRLSLAPPNSRRARVLLWQYKLFTNTSQKLKRKFTIKQDLASISASGLFDRQWYLSKNPEVARAKMNPALHYLLFGGFEGRDPGPNFSSDWYLRENQDVKRAGVNPLVHYLRYGKNEGRLAVPPILVDKIFTGHSLKLTGSVDQGKDQFTLFTICSKNFTAYAKTLFDSVKQFHPGVELVLFLCDGLDSGYDINSLPFTTILLADLGIPNVEEMAQRYNITEFNTAIKPYAFAYLFKKLQKDMVIYLDPDILILSPLQEILDEFSMGAECVLTPHILQPKENVDFGDNKFLQYGVFNLGFIGLRNTPEVIRIVDWWGRRLVHGCVINLEEGLFVDQKWVDLFPAFIKRTSILHHPGYNVAYWNLPQRKIELMDGIWYSNRQPLRFVHFSGHDLNDSYRFSRHVSTVTRDTIGDLKYLVDLYHERLFENGHAEYLKFPYSFNWSGASGVNLHTPEPPGLVEDDTDGNTMPIPEAETPPPGAQRSSSKIQSYLHILRNAACYAGGWSALARELFHTFKEGGHKAVRQRALRLSSRLDVSTVPSHATHIVAPDWMPHILVIDWSIPRPDQDAGSLSTFNLLKVYVDLGYDVTFIPGDLQVLGEYTEAVRALGVRCLHQEEIGSVMNFLQSEGRCLDFVMLCRAPVAAHYIPLIRQFAPTAKIILNTIDVHYLRETREAELGGEIDRIKKAMRTKEWELDIMQKCDVTIVLSSVEYQIVQGELPHADIRLIPLLYVDTALDCPPFKGRKDFLFIGGFPHTPNVDAVIYFCDEILPLVQKSLPGVKFNIVGNAPPPEILALEKQEGVIVHGFVKDVAPLFHKSRLSVAPLRYGAGIKGKIATSLAFGVPVIATSVALEGMDLAAGEHVLIGDDPQQFADALVRVYKDGELWNKLSRNGREQVLRTYSTFAIHRRIDTLMQDINPQHKKIDLYTLRSQAEYELLTQTISADLRERRSLELDLIKQDQPGFSVDGFCALCGCDSSFTIGFSSSKMQDDRRQVLDFRDSLACVRCGFTTRLRAAMQLFSQQLRPSSSAAIYMTEQATPLFHWLKDRYPLLVGSEYLGNSIPLGTEKDGLRDEDLTALTFADDSFDYILSFDVLEHVNDDLAALKEIHRCLKPGGTFLFSLPFSPDQAHKQVRARILPDGSIEHLLPPEYHGNPVDLENGVLCFRYFAWDLIHDLKQVGFEDPRVLSYWSRDYAYLGVEQFMFIAKKRPGKS